MKETELETKIDISKDEKDFYSNYEWSLNPILTLTELFIHMEEEVRRFDSLEEEWQREESRINIYLFACAAACTIDDYIAWLPLNYQPLINIFPKYHILIKYLQTVSNLPYKFTTLKKNNSVIRLRETWEACIESACKILLTHKSLSLSDKQLFLDKIKLWKINNLPGNLLKRRMKLNEGYRCQDLTHHDIIKLADRYLQFNRIKNERIVIIGPRTAGAYFAPLIKSYFDILGISNVSYATVRPKNGLAKREEKRLSAILDRNTKVILTDDYTNTGQSFRLLQDTIKSFGIQPQQITILAPIHPTKSTVNPASNDLTRVIQLNHSDLYKQNLFESLFIKDVLTEYYSTDDWDISFVGSERSRQDFSYNNIDNYGNDSETIKINSELQDHLKDGFQVRLKHFYEIHLQNKSGDIITMKILGKSVGWGWLGYHAFLAGTALHEFVPEFISLRNGILFEYWLDGKQIDSINITSDHLDRIVNYIIAREQRLKLKEDPKFYPPDTGWGWLEILNILRRPFGLRAGRIMNKAILEYLENSIKKDPVLVDGKIHPEEWFETNNRLIKLDFEHHNFGAPNHDIVDPAFDIAGACFEFNLSKEDEKYILNAYINKTGDKSILDRIILYKLLYASLAKKKINEEIYEKRCISKMEESNHRFISSWSYLIYSMNSFCGASIRNNFVSSTPDNNLFFLDIDGVLDSEVFGFQHTSLNGLYGIALLKAKGIFIIPNTGRSIEHVKNYCENYGFAAGIAEYGSVIITDNNQTEFPLIDTETIRQLSICRKTLINLHDVFIDTNYKYSLRAYRYSSHRTKGLDRNEAEKIIKAFGLDNLRIITREDDTYFVGKKNNKGIALIKLKEYLKNSPKPVYAMGDSEEDIPMLKAADLGFTPGNCIAAIKELKGKANIRITRAKNQNGFLEAVKEICKNVEDIKFDDLIDPGKANSVRRLIFMLLKVADQSRIKKAAYLIFKKNLLNGKIRI